MQSSADASDFSILQYSVCRSWQRVKLRKHISISEKQSLIDFIRMLRLEQKIFCLFHAIRATSEIHSKGKRLHIHKFKRPKEQVFYSPIAGFCTVFTSIPSILGQNSSH